MPTRLNTRCKWSKYETDEIIKNISIGGCFILTQSDLTMGDSVRVRIAVPKLLYMELTGLVVRKQSG
ncbi:MAG: PilZ domain-containing protein [Pyrinomonadaceae bacterium]|nr:PilZ domain-containing protein [Pyrinomonadaceae bacterium]